MLLTRDFSRLPQMEGFFAVYVTSGGSRPSDKGAEGYVVGWSEKFFGDPSGLSFV